MAQTTEKPYSREYTNYIVSNEWYGKTKSCYKLTKRHCVVFPWLRAIECHHLHYNNLRKELPVRDIVPVSKTAHKILHLYPLWEIKKVTKFVNALLRVLLVFWSIVWRVL